MRSSPTHDPRHRIDGDRPGLRAPRRRALSSARRAESRSAGGKVGRIDGPAFDQDDARGRGVDGVELRLAAPARAISASAPASLDAGRAAADHHEGEQRRWRAGSASRSARSKASSTRRRIASASSSVLSPGARAAQSSWPKYECVAPVATIKVVVGERRRRRRAGPRAWPTVDALDRRPSSTRRLRCLRRIQRIGDAMSPGDSAGGRDLIQQRLEDVVVVPIDAA